MHPRVSAVLVASLLAGSSVVLSQSPDCVHGSYETGKCICTPGWNGSVCDEALPASSCKEMRSIRGAENVQDGNYKIKVGSRVIELWCSDMHTSEPKEYITLPAGKQVNFAERYEAQLPTLAGFTPPCQFELLTTRWEKWGRSEFRRVRLDLQTLQVDVNDQAFADTSGSFVPFGSAEDFFGAGERDCEPKGRAMIDLIGTPFVLDVSSSDWRPTADGADVDVTISDDRRVARISCGGALEAGGCAISTLQLALEDSDESACVSNPCQHNGVCIEAENVFGFICECRGDFTGPTCAVECTDGNCDQECNCENGGSCDSLTHECVCPDGWLGAECQEFDFCAAEASRHDGPACEHEGTCRNIVHDLVETALGPCVFPFIYDAVEHEECFFDGTNAPWCSLSPNYDKDQKKADCIVHAIKPVPLPGFEPSPNMDAITQSCRIAPVGSKPLTIGCGAGPFHVISLIDTAIFGTPQGTDDCRSAEPNPQCNAPDAHQTVEKLCLGKTSCTIDVSTNTFETSCTEPEQYLVVRFTCGAQVRARWDEVTPTIVAEDESLIKTTTVQKDCSGASPTFHQTENGFTVSGFTTCIGADKPGIARVEVKTPWQFTRVRATMTIKPQASNTVSDTDNNIQTWGRGGDYIIAGTDTQVLVKGGTIASSGGKIVIEDTEVDPTRTFRIEASSTSAKSDFVVTEYKFAFYHPVGVDEIGLMASYSFDDPPPATKGGFLPDDGNELLKLEPGQSGSPEWADTNSGIEGAALRFDATKQQYLTFPGVISYQAKQTVSFSLWFRPQFRKCGLGSTADCDMPLICGREGIPFCLYITGADHAPAMIIGDSIRIYDDVSISDGEWTHIVVAIDDTDLRLFIDEVASVVQYWPQSLQGRDLTLELGRQQHRKGDTGAVETFFFSGDMDDLRVYIRQLSSRDAEELAGKEPSVLPLARFAFEDNLQSDTSLARGQCSNCPLYSDEGNAGVEGKSAYFDGIRSCVTIEMLDSAFDLSAGSTFSFWLKLKAPQSSMLIDVGTTVALRLDSSQIVIDVKGRQSIRTYRTQLPVMDWTHVAVRFRPGDMTVTVFINGKGSTFPLPPFTTSEVEDFKLGCSEGSRDFYVGRIDQLEVYGLPLSDADVHLLSLGSSDAGIPANEAECDFDVSNCGWVNQQGSDDWQRWHGPAIDRGLGPIRDHTSSARPDSDRIYCEATGHSYEFITLPRLVTWTEAKLLAEQEGGYLATITSADEMGCLRRVTNTTAWVGASDTAQPRNFRWVSDGSNEPVQKDFWAPLQPAFQAGQDFVGINWPSHPDGTLHTCRDNCPYHFGYIAEFEDGNRPAYKSDFSKGVDGWSAISAIPACVMFLGGCGSYENILLASYCGTIRRYLDHLPQHHGMIISMLLVVIGDWGDHGSINVAIDGQRVWTWNMVTEPGDRFDHVPGCGGQSDTSVTTRLVSVYVPWHTRDHATISIEWPESFSPKESLGMTDVTVTLQNSEAAGPCGADSAAEPCYFYANVTEQTHNASLTSPLLSAPKSPSNCRMNFFYDMRGAQSVSTKACSDLNAVDLMPDVCVLSSDTCEYPRTFSAAQVSCATKGARLCTAIELTSLFSLNTLNDTCDYQNGDWWTIHSCQGSEGLDGGLLYDPRSNTYECLKYLRPSPVRAPGLVCCADKDPDTVKDGTLEVYIEEATGRRALAGQFRPGGDGWVPASVDLTLSETKPAPFRVGFVAYNDRGSGDQIIAIDDVSFEGCLPDESPQPEETELFVPIVQGTVRAGVSSCSWRQDGNTASPERDGCILAVGTHEGVVDVDKAQSSDYLSLASSDFDALLSFKLGSSGTAVELSFAGGSVEGTAEFRSDSVLFRGILFGSQPHKLALDALSGGREAKIVVSRDDDNLVFKVGSKLLNSFSIGDVSLDRMQIQASQKASIDSFGVRKVLVEEGDDDNTEPSIYEADIPIRDGYDDGMEPFDAQRNLPNETPRFDDPTIDITYTDDVDEDKSSNMVGLRFRDIPVSRDDRVTSAYIQFTAARDSETQTAPFIIAIDAAGASQPLVATKTQVPRKKDPASSGGDFPRFYQLSSDWSSEAACQLIGGVWTGEFREDTVLGVEKYWSADDKLVSVTEGTQVELIDDIECAFPDQTQSKEFVSRKKGNNVVSWTPDVWLEGQRGDAQRTPDLKDLINEVLTEHTYAAETSLTFYISGPSSHFQARHALSYEGAKQHNLDEAFAPTLHLEYASAEDVADEARETVCQFPFSWEGRRYTQCITEANPRQSKGEVSRPWCGTEYDANENNFGFCTSHLITAVGGTSEDGAHCAFPFVASGKSHTDCITTPLHGQDGRPWCALTLDYDDDRQWGYCEIPTFGGTGGGDPCVFPFYYNGKRYEECTTDGGRGDDLPWCVVEETSSESHAAARWGFCSRGQESVESWSFKCDCGPGWYGHRCESPCPDGFYGTNCEQRCECSEHGQCDHVSGACSCAPGWTGRTCDTETSQSDFDCTKCRNEDYNLGRCSDEEPYCHCAPGWMPPYCLEGCPRGMYGKDCKLECKCQNGAICDAFDGSCDCPPGFQGATCSEPCDDGFFGEDCLEPCQCQHDGVCNHINGDCQCPDGWIGEHCQTPSQSSGDHEVFINELRLEPTATDPQGTIIEVAGKAGTVLSGWRLEFYGGVAENGRVAASRQLYGTIGNQQEGAGVRVFKYSPGTLLQGSPVKALAGVALIDRAHQVVQFLSIGGEFRSSGGATAGATSDNLGMMPTQVSMSYQLRGSGRKLSDFMWTRSAYRESFGRINPGQRFVSSSVKEQVVVRVLAGANLGTSQLKYIMQASSFASDLRDEIETALFPLHIPGQQISNLDAVVLPSYGLAIEFTLEATQLPTADAISRAFLRRRRLVLVDKTLYIREVSVGGECLPGTVDDGSGECVAVATSTSVPYTQVTTTSTTFSTTTTTTSSTSSETITEPLPASTSAGPHTKKTTTTSRHDDDGKHTTTEKPCEGPDCKQPQKKKGNDSTTTVVAVVAAVLVLAVIFGVAFVIRRRRSSPTYAALATDDVDDFDEEDADDGGAGTAALSDAAHDSVQVDSRGVMHFNRFAEGDSDDDDMVEFLENESDDWRE